MKPTKPVEAGSSVSRREFLGQALGAGAWVAVGLTGCQTVAKTGSKLNHKPNILILHSDQHNARVLGCAGHPDVNRHFPYDLQPATSAIYFV